MDAGYYRLRDGTSVTLAVELKKELGRLCAEIRNKLNEFLSIDSSLITPNEYHNISCYYISTHIIDKGQMTFNTLPDSLFIGQKDSQLVNLKLLLQRGGGNNLSTYIFMKESDDFTDIKWIDENEEGDMVESYSSQTLFLNRIFTTLQHKYPEKSKDELCYITCDIYAILRIYTSYCGITPIDPVFLHDIIYIFETSNELITFNEYIIFYSKYNVEVDINRYTSYDKIIDKLKNINSDINIPIRKHHMILAGGNRRTRRKLSKRIVTRKN
jgi:hypothetical protein